MGSIGVDTLEADKRVIVGAGAGAGAEAEFGIGAGGASGLKLPSTVALLLGLTFPVCFQCVLRSLKSSSP